MNLCVTSPSGEISVTVPAARYLEVAERLYLDAAGQPDQARIEFVGVCLRILPGDRDPLACADAGVR